MGDVAAAFPADRQPPELEQPSHRTFRDPAIAAETLLGFDAFASDPVEDTALLEIGMGPGNVVGFVSMQHPGAASGALDRLNQLDQRLKQLAVVFVGSGWQSASGALCRSTRTCCFDPGGDELLGHAGRRFKIWATLQSSVRRSKHLNHTWSNAPPYKHVRLERQPL